MEKIITKKLPPIFKMSVLWNILPYYGHLHRWRRLLEMINTKTKDIWDQNWEQLVYIGIGFKREIELDCLNEYSDYLRPNRSWFGLFSLSLSYDFRYNKFDFTILTDNVCEDEVIVIDSHDDIFKSYQIQYWCKDSISDILPAIKCPSFKSETKTFKTSEKRKIIKFIDYQNNTKSIVIENVDEKLSINLIYGDTIKIGPLTIWSDSQYNDFLDKLQERYKLWEIEDCACKPKKIRVWENNFEDFKYAIDQLNWISDINDVKLGVDISSDGFAETLSNYDTMFFDYSVRWINDDSSNFIFTGDSLIVVCYGEYFNFWLDQRTKDSEYSYIKGNIIKNNSINYFALNINKICNLKLNQTDEEVKSSENIDFIEDLKEISAQRGGWFIVFDKKDITLKINIDKVKMKMPEQECYSKVDVKINYRIESEDIICMLEHIPKNLAIRLEADHIEQIIELMKCKTLIEKLKEQRTKFLYNGIEIKPKIIESKMNGKY